jgi:O-acetyl-ADP-ribose deacetylase (regulator of RNase III)
MSSKAFFKGGVAPKLIYRLARGGRALEVWTTTCIVTNFGKKSEAACSILINPSNPELSGVKNFPYFPRGGPVPKENVDSFHKDWQPFGFVSAWGGMDVGTGMLYPFSVVDGLVHQLGGWKLEAECIWKRMTSSSASGKACPIGSAVQTTAGDDRLTEQYNAIVHTTPPFFQHDADPEEKLQKCYESAVRLAFPLAAAPDSTDIVTIRVATPLLGSGARGFPHEVAMEVASEACVKWCHGTTGTSSDTVSSDNDKTAEQTIVFGLLEKDLADKFSEVIQQKSEET